MPAGEVHRSIVAQRVELLRDVRAASAQMAVHDDLAIGWNFPESILNFVHRNIHRTAMQPSSTSSSGSRTSSKNGVAPLSRRCASPPGVIDFTYNGEGMHFPDVTPQVAMTAGVAPAETANPSAALVHRCSRSDNRK